MQPKISAEFTHHQYLRARLEAEFPDADEETLGDTLEGMTNTRSGSMARYEGFTEESEVVSLVCHDWWRGETWHGLRHI